MLTLLIGTDWTANTDAVLQMLAQDVADEKCGRIWMVPELISHDAERRLCDAAGDTASRFAQVVPFSRLIGRVVEAVEHGAEECLDNGGRVVAMAAAAKSLHSKLKAYASVETQPEFLMGLVDAVDEFKRCCITSKDLLWAAAQTDGSLAQKLEELSLILESYDALCQQGRRDPRDQMSWLLDELEDCDFARDHVFYIDGFPDFTRQHMAILEHFILNSKHVVISLNCDIPGSNMPGFEKAGATAAELIRIAKHGDIPLQIKTVTPGNNPLGYVSKHLLQGRIDVQPDLEERLFVHQTDSVFNECLAAADRVMTLVHDGARYRDISVVCADMNTYRNSVKMVFERCKIPVYISGTEPVLNCSVITTVLAALDAALSGFERREVLRYLKSMLSPLEPELCDRLENYAILWNISGKRWLEEWTRHPDGLGAKWTEGAYKQLSELETARKLAIRPLETLYQSFYAAKDLHQQVQSVYQFLTDAALAERLSLLADSLENRGDSANAQILNQLWEILVAALEQMYDVLGNTVWDPEGFTRLLKLLLSQYDVGTIPPVLDGVMVGPVSAMRCQRTEHLILLGALEGALPAYSGCEGVLSDQERLELRRIGVPLTGGSLDGLQVSFSEIYGVFCGVNKTACVSCPSGQPSYIYRRLRNMVGTTYSPDILLGPARADKTEAGALFAAVNDRNSAEELGVLDAYLQIREKINYRIGTIKPENVEKLYGKMLKLSASQVDRQADCRFSYFMRYGLRAQERKSAEIDPAEFGTYVHAVLEQTGRRIMEQGGFAKVSLDETLAIAREYSLSYARERFSDIDSERLSYLFRRNGQELEMIVKELWQELHTSLFAPVDFELGFGEGEDMEAIPVSGKRLEAQLRGFVDRVDVWKTPDCQYVRVVDYKTGKKDFDYCDVFNGLGLQMLLYLFALQDGGQTRLGGKLIPAGVQYFPARAPMVSADCVLTESEAEEERAKIWKRKGLLLSDEDVLKAMQSGDGPNRLCCSWKKDGTISGDVADREQFALLKAYVFALLGKMVDEIASGCVDPNPYTRGSSHNACAFCPYGAVCHQATVEGRRNYKMMTAQRFWDEVEKEMTKHGR